MSPKSRWMRRTGETQVVSYLMVNDFGVIINPMLVEGQAHGGVMQGIGQALMESTRYDADGQLMTGSFMDYALPHAVHAPSFSIQSHPVPAKTNVLGVKGCGEAGCAGSLPAVMNALVDALRPVGRDAHGHAGDVAEDLAGDAAGLNWRSTDGGWPQCRAWISPPCSTASRPIFAQAQERWFDFLRIPSVSAQPAHAGDCRVAAEWLRAELAGIGICRRGAGDGGASGRAGAP